ncbi:MAG: hypothetical protein HETSPECPRED_004305 [Heterodermia speciosa]|uniref:Uncharacterized protein n=1 Tax=Heterodermia speciosa TaxID=116794 RepID=A0A8H3FDD1_9LECA|nr:MAG: hypothetical protein HETSPECPRED_004305 [Heterodermia speciosa]
MRAILVWEVFGLSIPISLTTAYVLPSSPSLFPTSNNTLASCQYLRQSLTQPCWELLNVTGHLTQWWQDHEQDCVERDAGFATCYQQMVGVEQEQCAHTGPSMCDFPDDLSGYAPQEAYVLYTIFSIWQWFESIYEAIENADVSAQGPVGQIVKSINPIKPSTQTLGSFFQALTAITPVIALPASVGETSIKALARTIETALRQSPGVLKQLNPSGTLNSEYDQSNDIYDALSQIKTSYQANISRALRLVQDDYPTFSLFAFNGSFIAPRTDLQVQSVNLTAALTTAIVSQALTLNNIVITLARDTSPYALAHNGSLTTPSLIQCDGYDPHGLCSTWWYDPISNSAFALTDLTDSNKNFYDLLDTMFTTGWTTGTDLFLGARDCADWQLLHGGSPTPSLDTEDFTARCISNTQICVYDMACPYNDVNCLYTGEYGWGQGGSSCSPPKDYLQSTCPGDASDGSVPTTLLPAAYLGPMVRDGNPDRQYCHSS